jgi:hypothetical protein
MTTTNLTAINSALNPKANTSKDENKFQLISTKKNRKELKSPLESIELIKNSITMTEILAAIKQGRNNREY